MFSQSVLNVQSHVFKRIPWKQVSKQNEICYLGNHFWQASSNTVLGDA